MEPDEVRREWAERSGAYSPTYYAESGPNDVSETLAAILDQYVDRDAPILEVGCSSGRHLAHLRRNGFKDLAGVDINADAFEVMERKFPTLAATGTFHVGPIEEVLPEFEDDRFSAVYSVETLQHIHPDDTGVFAEVARVASDVVVTAENEGNGPKRGREGSEVSCVDGEFPLYHRDWNRVFTDLGLVEVVCEPGKRDTVRAFRVVD